MIHPTAIIEEDVVLGKNNTIEAYAIIKKGTRLGNNNVVRSFTVLGETPTSPKYAGLDAYLEIGNNNLFASNVTIQKGLGLDRKTIIGNDNAFYNNVTVAYNCHIGNHNIFVAYTGLTSNIRVKDYVTFGGRSGARLGLTSNVVIEDFAYIAACTTVAADVPPCMLVMGGYSPRIITYNDVKLQDLLAVYPQETEESLSRLYRIIKNNKSHSKVLEELNKLEETPLIKKFKIFYTERRSIMKG